MASNKSTGVEDESDSDVIGSMSDETFFQFIFISLVLVPAVVSTLGIIFNIINIVVFVKMGFSETINISLLGLAVADVGVLLTMVGFSVIYNPMLMTSVADMDVINAVNYVALGWPHVLFSRIVACLTTYITFERFLCVVMPLKVKAIITPTKTLTVVIGIYSFIILGFVPAFIANQIGPRFNPQLNQTTIGIILAPNANLLEDISLTISIFIQISSFILIVIFTTGLIQAFIRNLNWRNQSSSSKNKSSSRDKVLIKMVLFISVVYIACSFPDVAGTVAVLFVKDFSVKGRERNAFVSVFSVFFNISSLHSTASLFIYVRMSSKFQQKFLAVFKFR
ncbi:proteinase-activated receptor 1-like [Physella acuta]|uniref:proteinase-activated receptor 1-like n=1 Tax=Physella acuta TaxID=109671 RepID=UPI0027DC45DF|nr:proteinase-activated receptor 1-like [Physella acuta]